MSREREREREPLWRDELSIFTADERYVGRRQFAKFLVLGSLGMFAGNLWLLAKGLFRRPGPRLPAVPVVRLSELPVGGVRQFAYPGPRTPVCWCATRRTAGPPTARSARTCRARCTTATKAGSWSARATTGSSPSRMAGCCRARRRGRCLACASSDAATCWWRWAGSSLTRRKLERAR